MDLEFKAFQNYGIKEVELDEASSKFVREKEKYMQEKQNEFDIKFEKLKRDLKTQYEAKQIGKELF